jgi:hypothetical protein
MDALQQARMACNAAGLVDKTTEGSPKLRELKTLVQELCLEGGQKMVVFSQWREMTLMIEGMLRTMGVGFVHLNGQVPTDRRGELMERFANDDAVSVFISTDAGGSGLNLQAASVLVNMDVPWNPAVLEQRNARVHRLGQRNRVQIILMVAADAYEERVLQLVNSKQQLFDNVVDPEAIEEVVGVSTKSITALIGELNQQAGTATVAETPAPEPVAEQPAVPSPAAQAATAAPDETLQDDERLRLGIAAAQQQFGDRLQSVQASGGGLLLVLDRLSEQDDAWVDSLALPVPVAVIDVRTRGQLQRLGLDPLAAAGAVPEPEPEPERPWRQLADEKMRAARLLQQQGHPSAVPDLLCAALGAWAADLAQLDAPVSPDELAVWLYSQALPEGLVDERQAVAIAPLLGLRLAARVPEALLEQILQDIEALFATAAGKESVPG